MSHLRNAKKIMSGADIVRISKETSIFPWTAQKTVAPLAISKADNIYFFDADGKRYTDLNSMMMCSNIGHGNPRVIKAIQDQVEELCFAPPSAATRVRAELGLNLQSIFPPSLSKFFYTLGGAEANENAIKFARFSTGKYKIIARSRSYHGATLGAITLTGDYRRFPNEPAMNGVVRVSDPYMYRSYLMRDGMTEEDFTQSLLQQLEETIIQENPANIACMFLETITGSNGVVVPPKGYLEGVRAILTKYNILMVCDEVMAGFGRTGKWLSFEHWGVTPDIVTMAKGITSAYLPLGAVAVSDKVAAAFDEKPFLGGLTYNSHPVLLACANETINVMKDDKIIENAAEMGKVMRELHLELKAKHPSVGDVRSIGLFGCVELVKNRKTKEPMSAEGMKRFGDSIKEHGVTTFINGHMFLTNPPLIINKQQLRETFDVLSKALEQTDKECTN